MSDTLTGEQTPATAGATAPAAPGANQAAPVDRVAVPDARNSVPPGSRNGGRERPGVADDGVSAAGATGQAAPAKPATNEGERTLGQKAVHGLLIAVALVGMPLVGAVGFAASYSTLQRIALANGFSEVLAPWVPIGIDASILALLATDLVKVRRGHPQPILRFAAHAMVLVTVLLNGAEGTQGSLWNGLTADPVRALFHGVMPVLFVLGVEAGRHELMSAARIEDTDTRTDRIPVHRWVLSPTATPRLYRRMRLANVVSYAEMVEREQALEGYKVWLSQKYDGHPEKATQEERLPMTMAPRGYTVAEALALPAKWKAEAAEREEAEAERQRQEKRRKAEQDKVARILALEDDADVEEARFRVATRTGTAAAEAEAAKVKADLGRRKAERLAWAEEEAEESETAAAARRKAAEDERRAAEAEEAAAKTRDRAAATAYEAERKEAEAERLRNQRIAAQKQARLDEQATEEAAQAAADARLQTAQLEARAQQFEDYARLSQRERNVRRVARMLQSAGGHKESVPLTDIEAELSVRRTVASEMRTAAFELLKSGYQPDAILDGRPS